MNKKILRLISFFILLAMFSLTNATQQVLELNPYETKYTSNYKVTNNTNKKILAPISDTSWNILNNYKWISSDINNLKNSFFTFGSNQKINNSYTVGWFTISDASFSKTYWSRSSCSATCGWWTKFRTVTCDREDWVFWVWSLCWLTSGIETISCNTQPCSSSCSSQTSYTRQNVPLADALVWYIPWTSWAAAVKYNCRYNNGFWWWYYWHATARSWAYEAYNHWSQCKVWTTYTVCNWECWTTNNSCTTWTLNDIADTSTQYKWQCSWTNWWTTTTCSINKPVDCVWSWSDTSTCSETCWWWVKQQVYTITTPASNWWVACSNNTWDVKWWTTSCNTQACDKNICLIYTTPWFQFNLTTQFIKKPACLPNDTIYEIGSGDVKISNDNTIFIKAGTYRIYKNGSYRNIIVDRDIILEQNYISFNPTLSWYYSGR